MTTSDRAGREEQFLEKLQQIVLDNLSNEQFGVEDLAKSYGISRSQLHRKLKKLTKKSISRFIREIRLDEAHSMLKNDLGTVSEIAYKVGFSSPTYFNTCFSEYFGYPPGETLIRMEANEGYSEVHPVQSTSTIRSNVRQGRPFWILSAILVLLAVMTTWFFLKNNTNAIQATGVANGQIQPAAIPEKSIAVLPFEDMSENRNQGPFTEAMVVEINNHLVKIEGLLVSSRSSTMVYKDNPKSSVEIARELGVATLLTGNVQRAGDIVRVTAQLVDGEDDHFLWSSTYEADLADVFAIQSEIAQKVAEELQIQMSPELSLILDNPPTDNLDAYNLYLEVKSYSHDNETNTEMLLEAIRLDDQFADAYVELVLQKFFFLNQNALANEARDEYLIECLVLLKKAIELDPGNAAANRLLASTYLWHLYDFKKADYYFDRAISLNPSMAMTMYPFYLLPAGRFQEALDYNTFKVLPASPNSNGIWLSQALCYYYLGQPQNVERSLNMAIAKDSASTLKHHGYFMISCYRGDYKTVTSNYEKLDSDYHVRPRHLGMAAIAYMKLGAIDKADGLLRELEHISSASSTGSPAYFVAAVYAAKEDLNSALDWLERSFNNKEIEMIWLNVDPLWKSLQSDARFNELRQKMGFSNV